MLERPREGKGRIRWYTPEEETKMLAICEHLGLEDLRDFIIVGLDTGFRRAELLGLKTTDYVNGSLMLWTTKNGESHSVPCTERVKAILKARQEACEVNVFRTMTYATLRTQWEVLREKMGRSDDPWFIIHILRHTCATRLVSRGVPIKVVQGWMNHLSIATTLRYAHLMPEQLFDAAKALEPA